MAVGFQFADARPPRLPHTAGEVTGEMRFLDPIHDFHDCLK